MMNISLGFPLISNIFEQKHIKDPYPSLISPRPMTQFVPQKGKTIEDQRREKKTLACLIISADFLQGKSAFLSVCLSRLLGFGGSNTG
jgi:hypothetical protein